MRSVTNRGTVRRVLTIAFLLALLGGSVVGEAKADDVWTAPVPSAVAIEPFWTADGYAVNISIWRPAYGSRLCIEAQKTTTSGAERTIVAESHCVLDPKARPVDYRFDPTTWSAVVTGDLPTYLYTETSYLDAAGEWRYRGHTVVAGRVTFGLRWQATGAPMPAVSPPRLCYAPCLQDMSVGVRRPAAASGSVHFHGLGLEIPIGRSMPASMSYGLDPV